jgi:Zn finger protein HypA/HybF involved in hydrogenase expression
MPGFLDDTTEAAMWTCRNCNVSFEFARVEPEVDEQGFFFLCPACDYRNKLVDAGPDAMGRPKLVQTDD